MANLKITLQIRCVKLCTIWTTQLGCVVHIVHNFTQLFTQLTQRICSVDQRLSNNAISYKWDWADHPFKNYPQAEMLVIWQYFFLADWQFRKTHISRDPRLRVKLSGIKRIRGVWAWAISCDVLRYIPVKLSNQPGRTSLNHPTNLRRYQLLSWAW